MQLALEGSCHAIKQNDGNNLNIHHKLVIEIIFIYTMYIIMYSVQYLGFLSKECVYFLLNCGIYLPFQLSINPVPLHVFEKFF